MAQTARIISNCSITAKCAALPSVQKAQLSVQVEALLIEIVEALATAEAGDDQDHR